MLTMLKNQPRPFYMIFILEMWERFGYYSMQGILVLYFIRYLGFANNKAYQTFGAFFALVYAMVALGGYLGDKILGIKRTTILGLVILASGYLALACSNQQTVFWALGLICVGNGIFKANPANLLSKCYDQRDPKLHAGFTLYYMAINLGSIAALLLGPTISARYGYGYGYFISFLGIIFGLINYGIQRKHLASINTLADQRPLSFSLCIIILLGLILLTSLSAFLLQHITLAKNLILVVAGVVFMIYAVYAWFESKESRWRMFVVCVLMIEAITFFTLYQQMPTSINLFAVNNVRHFFLGLELDPQSFQVFNPIWIVVMSPVIAHIYMRLQKNNVIIPTPYKFAFGMFFCSISFLVLYCARFVHDMNGLVSPWWLVLSYFFQGTGELLVSALGVAMVAELVPLHITGFVMGMWYLTSSLAGFLGASVASLTALPIQIQPGIISLHVYTHAFAYIGLWTLAIAMVLFLIAPRLSRLIQ